MENQANATQAYCKTQIYDSFSLQNTSGWLLQNPRAALEVTKYWQDFKLETFKVAKSKVYLVYK